MGVQNSKYDCTAGIRNLEPLCQYSEGILASAVLVANHGGLEVFRKIFDQSGSLSFDKKFENATGISLNSFYDEVDQYLGKLGWKK